MPTDEPWRSAGRGRAGEARAIAAEVAADVARGLIELAGPSCVAVKPQLARFEALGPPGWEALEAIVAAAHDHGLLVIADGKRGDVPVTAEAYADALVGATPTPWGVAPGLGADAFTASPLLGDDSLEPLVAACERVGAGLFVLVRTSNPGAADLLDLDAGGRPLHERIAERLAALADRLAGARGLSGLGAVVGATEPRFLARIRELMPSSIMLLPGVGAQGGDPGALGGALGPHPASILLTASRSICAAPDPAAAAEELRSAGWALGGAR